MQKGGMREAETGNVFGDPKQLVGSVRRLSEFGPAYEVLKLVSDSEALIHVFSTGEGVALKIEDIMSDPISETIP